MDRNNHYVPQFILRQYGDHLCVFNTKTQSFEEGRNPRSIYSEKGLYPDDIEEGLQQRVETPFVELVHQTDLLNQKRIVLTSTQFDLLQKYLVVSILRTKSTSKEIKQGRHFYDNLLQMAKTMGLSEANLMLSLPPFTEKNAEQLSDIEYWYRTLRCLISAPNVRPETIIQRPDATYLAYYWSNILYSGHLSFWDASPYQDEFVLTDVGMTSELEPDYDNPYHPSHLKEDTVKHLITVDDGSNPQYSFFLMATAFLMASFQENFMMFPLSRHRMVVLVNPFFKLRTTRSAKKMKVPPLSDFTGLTDDRLFTSSEIKVVAPISNFAIPPEEDAGLCFTFNPVRLNGTETRYCNTLFLDQISEIVGFSSLEKVKRSVKAYQRLQKDFVPRVDYSGLYKILGLT